MIPKIIYMNKRFPLKSKSEMKTFEEYLTEQFYKQYNGLDDEGPDAEADWLAELEVSDWIDYTAGWVNEYIKEKQNGD